jgi:hypothetical protein
MILNLWLLIFFQRCSSSTPIRQACKISTFKIHKYKDIDRGLDFVIEPFQDQTHYIMTSQRSGLVSGDYVVVQGQPKEQQYKILEIDYYGNSAPDLWIAKLVPISGLVRFTH